MSNVQTYFIIAGLALFHPTLNPCLYSQTNAEMLNNTGIQRAISFTDNEHGLLTEARYFLITNETAKAALAIRCQLIRYAQGLSWKIDIDKGGIIGTVDKQLIVGGFLHVLKHLEKENPSYPPHSISFKPTDMPDESQTMFYAKIVEPVRLLDLNFKEGYAGTWGGDRLLERILKKIYAELEFTVFFRERLREAGYETVIGFPELMSDSWALYGKPWSEIAENIKPGFAYIDMRCILCLTPLLKKANDK